MALKGELWWCWSQKHLQGVWGQRGPCACPNAAPSTQLTPTFRQQCSMSQGGWAGALEGISLPACLD